MTQIFFMSVIRLGMRTMMRNLSVKGKNPTSLKKNLKAITVFIVIYKVKCFNFFVLFSLHFIQNALLISSFHIVFIGT
jgi:hypothetical protein